MYQLVLVRHGESVWNKDNKFTGWTNVDLSEVGKQEAQDCGLILKDKYTFDVAYTSMLKRAIHTCWKVLEYSNNSAACIQKSWRLNERHYGALQGLNKSETAKKHGEEQVKIWRRSFDIPIPSLTKNDPSYPGNDPLYRFVPKDILPLSECLKDTVQRVLPIWYDSIAPDILRGKQVIVVAHGNSLRALYKHIKGVSDNDIVEFNIPTAVPLIMELDKDLNYVNDHFLMDEETLKQKINMVASQGKA